MDAATSLYEIARCHGGLVTRAQAQQIGVADQRLAELTERGVVARVARGVYAISSSPIGPVDPRVLTRAHNLVLSFESAAAWLGSDLPEAPRRMRATASRNRGVRSDAISGVQLHRADLSDAEIVNARGVRVTSPLRTALDIARSATLDYAVAAVDALMRAKLLGYQQFIAAAGGTRGPGRVKVQLVASLVDPKSGSILESLARLLLWRNNVPAPTSQYPFLHARQGLIGYVDFAWEHLLAVLECDGYEFHSSRVPFQKDRRRWTAIGTSGWHLAVITWFDVTCEPEYVVAAVNDLLSLETRSSCTQRCAQMAMGDPKRTS
jgi:hypothetical protein